VVPPWSFRGSRAWWVSTKTGWWEGWIRAPVAVPAILSPGPRTATEHAAAHHARTDVLEESLGDLCTGVHLAASLAVGLPEDGEREEPLVKLLSAHTERLALARVRPGDEAVARHHEHPDVRQPRRPQKVAVLMDVPDMDTVIAAMEGQDAADAMAYDTVVPETLVLLVER
jgi:hypothetical protein